MSLKSIWKRRAEKQLTGWAKRRIAGWGLPLMVTFNHDESPKVQAAIVKFLEEMKNIPAQKIISLDSVISPAPTKKLVYFNMRDVKIV